MTRKTAFFEGWSWFKFNNFGLALGTNWKFYTSVAERLELKVRKFLGINSTFVEVTGEKPVGRRGDFLPSTPHHPSLSYLSYLNFSAVPNAKPKNGTNIKKQKEKIKKTIKYELEYIDLVADIWHFFLSLNDNHQEIPHQATALSFLEYSNVIGKHLIYSCVNCETFTKLVEK